MKTIFFEVETQDFSKVQKAFPEAKVFSQDFSEDLIEKCKNAEVFCGMVNSDFSAKNLEKIPNLKLLITRSVGTDHIDLKYCLKNNIQVHNIPDYGAYIIAEHVFAILLASIRNIIQGNAEVHHEHFSWSGLKGMALKGKTLGIVGTGKIGQQVAHIASHGFGMKVIAYDKFPNADASKSIGFNYADSLEEVWKESDIISLHAPLTEETEHMINKKSISQMKDGVVLVNTARGGLINTKDLVEALKQNKFYRVALDVIEHEHDIHKDEALLKDERVLITPHIAFYTNESINSMYEQAFEMIKNY